MEQEVTFEALLERHRIAVERYINFRMPSSFDADDVTQETYLAAYIGFPKLRRKELFKPWILSIAKNQCNLWFRRKYGNEAVGQRRRVSGGALAGLRVRDLASTHNSNNNPLRSPQNQGFRSGF